MLRQILLVFVLSLFANVQFLPSIVDVVHVVIAVEVYLLSLSTDRIDICDFIISCSGGSLPPSLLSRRRPARSSFRQP